MKALYNNNGDFRAYVDKYADTHHISVDTALTHNIVKHIAEITYTIETFNESSIRQEAKRNGSTTEH